MSTVELIGLYASLYIIAVVIIYLIVLYIGHVKRVGYKKIFTELMIWSLIIAVVIVYITLWITAPVLTKAITGTVVIIAVFLFLAFLISDN